MPTFNQLVRKGREKVTYKSTSPAMQKGLKENVIIGKLIPAGSGLACYRNFETNEEPAVPAEPEDDGVDLSDLANISNAL